MTTPITKKEAAKPGVSKRALIQLRVTGFKGNFPNATNLQTAVQNRATALGYKEVGTVTIDSASTEDVKLINIAATNIEPVRLVGILDDVLKTFMSAGYVIELVEVAGPVRTEMKLSRMTRREYKASKAVEVKKSAPEKKATSEKKTVTKAAKATMTKSATDIVCKRTKSTKKFARKYATRELAPDAIQTRTYKVTASEGISPEIEANLMGIYINAMWAFETAVDGTTVKVMFNAESSVDELDAKVASIAVAKIPGKKTDANLATVTAWQQARSSVYVATSIDPQAYMAVGPKDQLVDLPQLNA